MPRYEIVAHVIRELECDTAEDAAAIFRKQLLAESRPDDTLVHLAVWREDPELTESPIPASLRHKLIDFFATLERCAEAAEDAFRGRVEAILMASAPASADADDRRRPGSNEPVAPA